jgi:two-component system LytT family sensor kinase
VSRPSSAWSRRWLIAAACFTAAAVLSTGQVWVDYAYAGRPLSWARAFAVALADWELWTLLTPIVLWLAARVPVSRGRLGFALAIHVPASLGLTIVKLVLESSVARAIIGAGRVPFSLLKLHLTLVTYWAIVAAVGYAEQQRLSRERELRAARLQGELARAQVDALRAQIQPHFLFNTLNAIAGLMREDVEAADVMLVQLGELLRGALETQGLPEVPLSEELGLLRTYLAIQQARYGERLQVTVDVPPDIERLFVPTLILQPLVENAIRHGFAVTPGPGRLTVGASARDDRLVIDVLDEGPGPPDPLKDGYGLANTRSRLRALYGPAARLTIEPAGPRGTLARLDLPRHSEPTA